jgi:hypothetical protein
MIAQNSNNDRSAASCATEQSTEQKSLWYNRSPLHKNKYRKNNDSFKI